MQGHTDELSDFLMAEMNAPFKAVFTVVIIAVFIVTGLSF
jgi:hypothetical protein